ncbi:terpenoid synthase [Obba rivulosa]|uniref:(2E,6E)-farnesyl diphosphate synthase n=1 Tax=Obba rivulosa TaxID=1052685 RepID=A0A8E2AML0_9APHY|nr:terpenoid synthase [Obba rivulosa]
MSAQLTMSLAPHILQFQTSLLNRVTASTPLLTRIAQYYILQPSKRIRPCLIFLIAQATNGLGAEWPAKLQASGTQCPHETVLPSQVSLAEVIEMIHVASLLHDDVLDDAPLRRGAPSAPAAFGNKRAILGGDFLLGRAMALCASLGTPAVMSVVADALCALVDGELIQAEAEEPARGAPPADGGAGSEARPAYLNGGDQSKEVVGLWEDYLKKTYMKTASLFSQALQAAVMLGGAASADPWREVAATYGSELGMAFQIIDDLLDFKGDQKELGKAANAADLKLGLVTAPAFFALEEDERMLPLILRRFEGPGDVEKALEIVLSTQALERTRELAQAYATRAYECLEPLPPSPAKVALQTMTEVVMARQR